MKHNIGLGFRLWCIFCIAFFSGALALAGVPESQEFMFLLGYFIAWVPAYLLAVPILTNNAVARKIAIGTHAFYGALFSSVAFFGTGGTDSLILALPFVFGFIVAKYHWTKIKP